MDFNQTLYMSISANFIKTTYTVQQMQQFKLEKVNMQFYM